MAARSPVNDQRQARPAIRPLEAADRPALTRMYDEFRPRRAANGLPPDEPRRVKQWLDDVIARGRHLVAQTTEGDIVGHVLLVPVDHQTTELAIFVDHRYRGRGLGTALNRAALDLARRAGWRRVWLCVDPSNRAAIRSYRKAGFVAAPGTEWAPEIEMVHDFDHTAAALSAIGRPNA
jgi:RimJ/RimL family protein N-acetyltransferase